MERIGADAFDAERLRRPGTWAVVFLADWCPFCVSFAPKFAELDGTGSFRVAVADVSEESSPLWDRFRIEVVPTVIVFRDGSAAFRRDGQLMRGLGDKDLAAIRSHLAPP